MELQNSPEAMARKKILNAIITEFKNRIKEAGLIGLIIIGDSLQAENDTKNTGIIQIVSGKTMVSDFTIFTQDKPGEAMREKDNFSTYQYVTTLTMLETLVEILSNEVKAHKTLLQGVKQLDSFDRSSDPITDISNN